MTEEYQHQLEMKTRSMLSEVGFIVRTLQDPDFLKATHSALSGIIQDCKSKMNQNNKGKVVNIREKMKA